MLMVPRNSPIDVSRALMAVADRVEKQGPMNAEIVPGAEPGWFIVVTHPGQESVAAGHLIGRRFGIFQPQGCRRWISKTGKKCSRTYNLFPTYLFIFVWDIDKHQRRILGVPGVQRILCSDDKPVRVPEKEIIQIKQAENAANPIFAEFQEVKVRKRRRGKSDTQLVTVYRQIGPDDVVSVSSKSYWNVEEPERFDLLHKALGLAA